MILVTIQMKVLAEKRKELSQTIALLIGSIKTEKGCRRCDFCRSMEDENRFFLFEEWDTREDFDSHAEIGVLYCTSGDAEPPPGAL